MFEPLFARLSDRYHLVAPDYPGFGHSDWPDSKTFGYTFDHLAEVVSRFTEALGLSRYTLYMQDYGGPVGVRVALAHPVVIGVHSPEFELEFEFEFEFEFERNAGNVRRAAKDIRVDYPIAIDSEHAIWRAFGNQYWPALHLIDAQRRIRYHHFGEGDYEQSEKVIQQLLLEAGVAAVSHDLVSVDARGAEAPADWSLARSP